MNFIALSSKVIQPSRHNLKRTKADGRRSLFPRYSHTYVPYLSVVYRSLLILLLFPSIAQAQVNDIPIRQRVLKLGVVDSEFVFGNWNGDQGKTESHLKYLGQVTMKNGRVFKIVNSTWLWGPSRRATNRILVFDALYHYVGSVYDHNYL